MADWPIWDCIYRVSVLNKFISHLRVYDAPSTPRYRRRGGVSDSDENIESYRKSINLMTPRVSRYLLAAGQYPLVSYRDPPALGGRTIPNIDMMQNIFNLDDFSIPIQTVVDYIQRAIGYYQDDMIHALFRTINPFWWLWKLVAFIIRLPFRIVGWAGFESKKIEASSGGKLYKAIAGLVIFMAGLVTFTASIVQILDSFDLIQPIKDYLGNLVH